MDDLKLHGRSEGQLDSLVRIVRTYSQDIGMQFGIDKGAVLTVKKGRR